jgi:Ferredoxin-like domain in Api92-like protein
VLARAEYECLIKTGYATAEYWAWSNWGTPRNVCYARYSKMCPFELTFNTLYAPPVQALAELSRLFADVTFELYYEKDDLSFHGWAVFADGDVCDERQELNGQ